VWISRFSLRQRKVSTFSADFPCSKESFLCGRFSLPGRDYGWLDGNDNLPHSGESFLLSKKHFDVLKKVRYMKQTVGVESKKDVFSLLKACDAERKGWSPVLPRWVVEEKPFPFAS
jgi:hypothetical protein